MMEFNEFLTLMYVISYWVHFKKRTQFLYIQSSEASDSVQPVS